MNAITPVLHITSTDNQHAGTIRSLAETGIIKPVFVYSPSEKRIIAECDSYLTAVKWCHDQGREFHENHELCWTNEWPAIRATL